MSTKIEFPATKSFVTALLAECAKQGLTPISLDPTTESGLHQNGGWCFLRFEGTHADGASLIIQKSVGKSPKLHSHVDLSGHDGFIGLPKKNGKVICHFESDLSKVSKVLKFFVAASKRATATPVAKVQAALAVAASEAPVAAPVQSWTDEELEAIDQQMFVNVQ